MADEELLRLVRDKLGAEDAGFSQQFTIYFPNMYRNPSGGRQIEMPQDFWHGWINRAKVLLGQINRGSTAMAAANGYYIDELTDKDGNTVEEEVHEKTVVTYAFIEAVRFRESLDSLRELLHDFGRRARQGSVFFDFDGVAFRISQYDAETDPEFREVLN